MSAGHSPARPIVHAIGKLDRLVVFDAVLRAGSLTGAAMMLGVTQPAVSRQISLLEDELQTPLFVRENSRVSPTPSAIALAPFVDEGLRRFEEGLADIHGRADVLTLAVQPAIAESWFAPRMIELREAMAPTSIRLLIFERDDDLVTIGHDVSIRFGSGSGRHHRSSRLVAESVVPVASPQFAEQYALGFDTDPQVLLNGPRLLHLDPMRWRWMDWRTWFSAVGVDLEDDDGEIIHPNYGILIQQALAGRGVVLGWHTLLGDLVGQGQLVPVGPAVRRPELGYHIVWPPGLARHPGVERLRRWLSETIGQAGDLGQLGRGGIIDLSGSDR